MFTNRNIFKITTNHIVPAKGELLISEPFLCDCMFERSVVLLVDHSQKGTMGFIMNKPFPWSLNEVWNVFPNADFIPLYQGGPINTDTLFFIHTLKEIPHSIPISQGFFLNGDFPAIKDYVADGNPVNGKIRFFLGYAGWEDGQLLQEIEGDTWIIGKEKVHTLMDEGATLTLWKESLKRLGYKYELWSRFPVRPAYN